jgi:hypothetical protein
MKAYDAPVGAVLYLSEGGRSGEGVVKSGTPPSDPQEGIYVVLDNGNYWERVIEGGCVTPAMFGALDSASRVPFQEAENFASSNGLYVLYDRPYTITLANAEGSFYPVGVICRDNTKHIFVGDGSVRINDTASEGYQIFQVWDTTDALFIRPKIIGDVDSHTGTTGEFGMGIDARGTTNLRIIEPNISKCWGDGIYIGTTASQDFCKSVFIDSPVLPLNRRQGISVISVDGFYLTNPVIENTGGTSPAAGIDFEPNAATHLLKNIRISGITTKGNDGYGILFALQNLDNTSQDVDVEISGHTSDEDYGGFSVQSVASGVGGRVIYNQSQANLSDTASIYVRNKSRNSFLLKIIEPKVKDANVLGVGGSQGSGIVVANESGDVNYGDIGNVKIIQPEISDNRVTKKTPYGVYVNCTNGNAAAQVDIIDPISISGMLSKQLFFVGELWRLSDPSRILSENISASGGMTVDDWKSYVTNSGAGAAVTYELPSVPTAPEITFTVESANLFRIVPDALEFIRPITSSAGATISSSQIGDTITLRKDTTNEWRVVKQVGAWTTP